MGKVIGFYTDKRGRVRPITAKKGMKAKTLFFPPTYKEASRRISIASPRQAIASSRWLLSEFNVAKTQAKKVRLKRFAILAYNRARASLNRENLSVKERREMGRVARIYYSTYKKMRVE